MMTAENIAVADAVLGLGTGMRGHASISRADHERLLPALEALGANVQPESGTVSFVHGTYTAPWTRDTIAGAGYELTISWSRNAATGADNGHRIAGTCPQWRVNAVACKLWLARGPFLAARYRAELEALAAASPHPEEARAAATALRALAGGTLAGGLTTACYQAFAEAVAAEGSPA